jgi:hypothetical protein
MARDTQATRTTIEQHLNALQGEQLMAEVDKLLSIVTHLDERVEYYQDQYWKTSAEVGNLRDKVRNYFKDELDGDKDASVEMELDDINDLLNRIGAEEIKFTYSAEVTITFTITGVEADSEEDAKSKILDAISYQVSSSLDHDNTEDDNYEIDNVEAE